MENNDSIMNNASAETLSNVVNGDFDFCLNMIQKLE